MVKFLIENFSSVFRVVGKSIVEQFRAALADNKNDIHAKMMSRYPQVSEWW
jgi:hypothetical protein